MNTYEALYAMYFMEKPITLHSSLLYFCSYIESATSTAPANEYSTKFKLHSKNMINCLGCMSKMNSVTEKESFLTKDIINSLVTVNDWKRRFSMLLESANGLTEIPKLKIYLDRNLTNIETLVVSELNSTACGTIIEFVCIRK